MGHLSPVPGTGPNAKKFVLVRVRFISLLDVRFSLHNRILISFVRQVNNAPVPIPSCQSGPSSSCPLAQFEAFVNGPQARANGDFVQRCGLANVTGAPDVVDIFTNPLSAAAMSKAFTLGIDPQVGVPAPP